MRKYKFIEFFTGVEGELSYKRLQTTVFMLLFVMAFIANLFWGFMVSEYLLEILSVMILYGYTGIVVEKFSKRGMTSVAANDQAMLMETQVSVEHQRVNNAIETDQKLADQAIEEEIKEQTPKQE